MNTLAASSLALGLLLGMLLLLEIGRRLGMRRLANDPEGARAGTGTIEGAVFALLGLLVAFTFSGAAARFDTRRALIVEETNAIGTAYLRLDLLPAGAQPPLRDLFRRYVDTRLEAYRKLPDLKATWAELDKANRLQGEIWSQAVVAGRAEGAPPAATMLLLPALNDMIDITTTRTMASKTHPPVIIFAMLFGLALASALLAGYGMAGGKSRNWLHMLGFAAVMAVAVYVILDLEFPRLGLIRVDAFDQALVELRESMK
ncbi:MAG: DUF4239 domain-containing protein [Candidatus Contendobacter sp.]|nr:DUF4239 domain-containing protein [Candidatus Contendobacter sp.]MDG4556869.1 DUF4239 domain-containing protein [Candidatus Contendobacter sp.]